MSTAGAVITAVVFVWLGMVVAISFVEAPLKFRAPGVSVAIGLGIGRLVFRALNSVEILLAGVVVAALVIDPPARASVVAVAVAVAMLLAQLVFVRPRLTRRSNAVLAGDDAPRSHAHYAYVGLETVKVAALLTGGIVVLAGAVG
ncbi:hypothetical protein ACIBCN_39595 [Nocardia sp. NPDC051052]|uniref:hypothetical protein n=1 Tax=Nocardia sp. NPDC051052 TaxID=3364322 RepID=UPI00379F232C